MQEQRRKLVSARLGSVLSKVPSVLTVLNNGSTVVGTDQVGSDVDFTVVVRNERDKSRVLAVLQRNFPFLGLDHGVPSFRDQRRLCITILALPELERILERLYGSVDGFLAWQGVVQHKIVEAIPLYDPQGLLGEWQRRASVYPVRIQRAVVSRALRSLEDARASWGFRNEFHFAHELPRMLENVGLALYARNRRLFMLPFKRMHKDLKELHPDIESDLYQLARCGRSAAGREKGRKALERIIVKLRGNPGPE